MAKIYLSLVDHDQNIPQSLLIIFETYIKHDKKNTSSTVETGPNAVDFDDDQIISKHNRETPKHTSSTVKLYPNSSTV